MNAHLTTDGGSIPPTYTINVQLKSNKMGYIKINNNVNKWFNINLMDSQDFFQVAIYQGNLSTNLSDDNYAGRYMFMRLSSKDHMAFKNIETRKYLYVKMKYEQYMRVAINKD